MPDGSPPESEPDRTTLGELAGDHVVVEHERLNLDHAAAIGRLSALTIRACVLAGPLILDFSALEVPCELTLDRVTGAAPRGQARPAPGARVGPSIVIICPQLRRGLLTITASDLDLEALTIRELRAPDPEARELHSLGRVAVYRSVIDAIEAARISCEDIELRGLACRGRLILSEAIVDGSVQIEHARIGGALKLPGEARQVWIRRCELRGGAYASGGEIHGPMTFERVEWKGSSSVSINGVTAHGGIAILDSRVEGNVSLSHCRTPTVSLEDTTVKGSTTLAVACPLGRMSTIEGDHSCVLLGAERRTLRDSHPYESLVIVSATRGRFKKSFTVRWADRSRADSSRPDGRQRTTSSPAVQQGAGPNDQQTAQGGAHDTTATEHRCSCQPRGIALWALAATFEGPTQCILAGPNLMAESRFLQATDFELTGGERTTLDLTDVMAGSAALTVTGTGGDERVTYVDGCTAETLRLERVDLRGCRFAGIRVQQLRLGSDVGLYKREPRELIADRPIVGRIWTYFNWILRFFVHVSPHKVLDEREPHPPKRVPLAGRRIPGVPWTAPWLRRAPTQRPRSEVAAPIGFLSTVRQWFARFGARQHRDDSLDEIRQAQELARIYRMLSGAFDGQGDASLAGDFAWQHARWRRLYLGRLTQFENRRLSGDEAAQVGAPTTPAVEDEAELGRASKLRRFYFRSPFGGITFGWIVMRGYEGFGGSGVRARTPLAWLVVATAVCFGLTDYAQTRNPLCGDFSTRITQSEPVRDRPSPTDRSVVVYPTDGTDFAEHLERTFPVAASGNVSEVCLALRNASTTALTVKAIMPLASVDPVVNRSDSSLTLLFLAGHVVGAFLIGLFAVALANKARIRRFSGA